MFFNRKFFVCNKFLLKNFFSLYFLVFQIKHQFISHQLVYVLIKLKGIRKLLCAVNSILLKFSTELLKMNCSCQRFRVLFSLIALFKEQIKNFSLLLLFCLSDIHYLLLKFNCTNKGLEIFVGSWMQLFIFLRIYDVDSTSINGQLFYLI